MCIRDRSYTVCATYNPTHTLCATYNPTHTLCATCNPTFTIQETAYQKTTNDLNGLRSFSDFLYLFFPLSCIRYFSNFCSLECFRFNLPKHAINPDFPPLLLECTFLNQKPEFFSVFFCWLVMYNTHLGI